MTSFQAHQTCTSRLWALQRMWISALDQAVRFLIQDSRTEIVSFRVNTLSLSDAAPHVFSFDNISSFEECIKHSVLFILPLISKELQTPSFGGYKNKTAKYSYVE